MLLSFLHTHTYTQLHANILWPFLFMIFVKKKRLHTMRATLVLCHRSVSNLCANINFIWKFSQFFNFALAKLSSVLKWLRFSLLAGSKNWNAKKEQYFIFKHCHIFYLGDFNPCWRFLNFPLLLLCCHSFVPVLSLKAHL